MNNWSHPGFTLNQATLLPELEGTLYRLTHDKTGLELVWLERDEENKTFGIAFETLPWDDTGVFHILEHSVLCGSDKYPVKEPFVELMKSSMNTFLNALTFQDKTFYPISSRNDKDFIHLTRVYLDAVFCPLIYSRPEIFYQEGWHHEPDEDGGVSYKGVVFNEMKGAFASADELVMNELGRLLFPDTPYGFVSGGDPAAIPDLSYEAFLEAHRRFYSPSNAYVFLDGRMDIHAVLDILQDEYLCRFQRTERMAPPPMQAPVSGRAEGFYELPPEDEPEGRVRLAFGKVIGTFDQRERLIAAQILADVLCGSNQSPLCRALLSQGLAEDVSMGVNDGLLQPWLVLDIKNVREENLEPVRRCIETQLRTLAEQGLDHGQLEAVMANAEFRLRERDYGYYPQGIVFGFCALDSWLYGGDPAANLEIGDLFVRLREKLQQGYFEELLRQLLLDNPHSAQVVLRPSHTAGQERRAREQERLARESAAWTEEERAAVMQRQQRLLAWQETEDSPEQLACIPQLSLSDIPAQPERIPTRLSDVGGVPLLLHPLHTAGIAYVSLYFDADSCTEEELSCLSFAASLLGECDTNAHSAQALLDRTRLLCGTLDIFPTTYIVGGDPGQCTTKLCASFSALTDKLPQAMAHVLELLTQTCFQEETARDILRQSKLDIFQGVVMSGSSAGLNRLLAQYAPAGVAEEHMGGLCFYDWLKRQDEHWDFPALCRRMETLLERIVSRCGLTVSVSGVPDEVAADLAAKAIRQLPHRPLPGRQVIRAWGRRREGIAIPADVSFAVRGGDLHEHGGTYHGSLQLAGQIISLGYLWNVIRVQGGAYGAGMVARDSGLTACYSYRDPDGVSSLRRYTGCADFLRQQARRPEELTGFIIGAVAGASPLMTPRTKARIGDTHYFTRLTWEQRCQRRQELLSTTPQELLELADVIERTIDQGGLCLIGSRELLERCPELEQIITL